MGAFEDKDKIMVAGGGWQARKGKKWHQPQGCDRKWGLSVSLTRSELPPRGHQLPLGAASPKAGGKREVRARRCLEDRVPEGQELPWEVFPGESSRPMDM